MQRERRVSLRTPRTLGGGGASVSPLGRSSVRCRSAAPRRAAMACHRAVRSSAALALALALALLAAPGAAQSPNSLPATLPEETASKIVITPAFGQCFTNGTTTFRSNLPVKWLLVPFDGDAPFYVASQSQQTLTVVAGHRGGRLLVVAQAAACAAGSVCAEQLTSPACSGVATGEITLAEAGAGVCSQAYSNASWTIVPWWKARAPLQAHSRAGGRLAARKRPRVARGSREY